MLFSGFALPCCLPPAHIKFPALSPLPFGVEAIDGERHQLAGGGGLRRQVGDIEDHRSAAARCGAVRGHRSGVSAGPARAEVEEVALPVQLPQLIPCARHLRGKQGCGSGSGSDCFSRKRKRIKTIASASD